MRQAVFCNFKFCLQNETDERSRSCELCLLAKHWEKSDNILQMVQDGDMVTMNSERNHKQPAESH